MNPQTDTYLWEYGNREIYEAYDKIFDCKGHGWSNLQSVHINLPFFDDSEFVKLHQSIRIILPLIPALSASSPFVEGKTQLLDSRLFYYENNQKKIPSITGKVIPESIYSMEDYYNKILYPMYKDIEPYDPEGILQEEWLNSRGAIARFERYAIEIRLMDIQESPLMDFTLILLWVNLIQYMIQQNLFNDFDTQDLYKIYQEAICCGIETLLPKDYLKIWNINKTELSVKDFIKFILRKIDYPKEYLSFLEIVLNHGNLSQRILKRYQSMKGDSTKKILQIYQNIAECLANNHYFL
jgi:carboxylate-amine ligase